MGIFSKGKKNTFSESEISWKGNSIKINGAFFETEGLIGAVRIPLDAIETVVIETNEPIESFNVIKAAKEAMTPRVVLVGKGTKLAYLKVGIDGANEIQEWILDKIQK